MFKKRPAVSNPSGRREALSEALAPAADAPGIPKLDQIDLWAHAYRAVRLAVELGRRMGMTERELALLRGGAFFHDIGMIIVPDHILFKRTALTDEEWQVVRRHPTYSFELLSAIPELRALADIPYCHHEKWDGTGYPQGLRGKDIPLAARVFAVVDTWDALRSDRSQRSAWTADEAMEYLCVRTGTDFDPEVVEAFMAMAPD